jgi:hypothetical protein
MKHGDRMNAAILPDELVARSRRYLDQLGKGETGYIVFTAMFVMPDRSCYLDLRTELREPRGVNIVKVRRSDDGDFHVTVPSDRTYHPGAIKTLPVGDNLAPVASITVALKIY